MKFRHDIRSGQCVAVLFAALLVAACSDNGLPSGSSTAHATVAEAQEAEGPTMISHGEAIVLADFAVAGSYTVFDFMSEYCPPCKQISPWMDRLHRERDGVQVIKVDINRPGVRGIDWQSPVARQFGLSSIPHFKVLDAEGKLVAEGDAAWEMLVAWLMELPTDEDSGKS